MKGDYTNKGALAKKAQRTPGQKGTATKAFKKAMAGPTGATPMTAGRKGAATKERGAIAGGLGKIRAGLVKGGGKLNKAQSKMARNQVKALAGKPGGPFQGPMPKRTGARAAAIFRATGVTANG